MVEVFKTNISNKSHANMLIDQIHKNFTDYKANFDLKDCDNILRIKSTKGIIQADLIVDLLKVAGFHAEVLPDAFYPVTSITFIDPNVQYKINSKWEQKYNAWSTTQTAD